MKCINMYMAALLEVEGMFGRPSVQGSRRMDVLSSDMAGALQQSSDPCPTTTSQLTDQAAREGIQVPQLSH